MTKAQIAGIRAKIMHSGDENLQPVLKLSDDAIRRLAHLIKKGAGQ